MAAVAIHGERSIEVVVPVRTAYDQWSQLQDFHPSMSVVQDVEQIPGVRITGAATTGTSDAAAVHVVAVGPDRTQDRLTLTYEPERIGDDADVVKRRAVVTAYPGDPTAGHVDTGAQGTGSTGPDTAGDEARERT